MMIKSIRKPAVLFASLFLALILVTPAASGAQFAQLDFGGSTNAAHTPELVSLAGAQAELDYRILLPTAIPSGYVLVGAFFPLPRPTDVYRAAGPEVRSMLVWQDRVRPVSVLYRGPGGSFVLSRSSITVGQVPAPQVSEGAPIPPPITARGRGLETLRGERRVSGELAYVVRQIDALSVPGPAKLEGSMTEVTWEQFAPASGGLVLVEMLWSLAGTINEQDLVAIAKTVR